MKILGSHPVPVFQRCPVAESLTDVAKCSPRKGGGAGACDGACVYDTFMLSVVDELLYEKSEFYSNRFIFYFSWSWFHVSLVDMCQHVKLVVFLIGSRSRR